MYQLDSLLHKMLMDCSIIDIWPYHTYIWFNGRIWFSSSKLSFHFPKPLWGNWKHTTSWKNIISNHLPWVRDSFLSCYNSIFIFIFFSAAYKMQTCKDITISHGFEGDTPEYFSWVHDRIALSCYVITFWRLRLRC